MLKRNEIGTERGNIWLHDEDGNQIAWIRLEKPNTWLEISICPENYPGLNVNEIEGTDKELAAYILDRCAGWSAKKLNLEGIELDEAGYIPNPTRNCFAFCEKCGIV